MKCNSKNYTKESLMPTVFADKMPVFARRGPQGTSEYISMFRMTHGNKSSALRLFHSM